MQTLHVQLFGSVQISLPHVTTPLNLQRANQLLLAYFMLQPRQFFSREHLIGIFWAEKSETRARQCLRSTLWRLRHLLEAEEATRGLYLVTTPTGEIGFNWDSHYWLDVEEFRVAVDPIVQKPVDLISEEEVAISERALDLYHADLLEEFYDDWALREREQLRETYLSTLAQLMHYFAQHELFDKSLVYGRRILELDPLREQTHRGMMRLYAASGQRPLAIRQYEMCRQILEQQLGIEPMAETRNLYHRIASVSTRRHGSHRTNPDPVTAQLALFELKQAMQHLDKAHAQMQSALELVQSFAADCDDPETE